MMHGRGLWTRCLIFQGDLVDGVSSTALRSCGVRGGTPCSGGGRVVLRPGRISASPDVVGRSCEWRLEGERLWQEVSGRLSRFKEDSGTLPAQRHVVLVSCQHRGFPLPSESSAWLMLGEALRCARSLATFFALIFLPHL